MANTTNVTVNAEDGWTEIASPPAKSGVFSCGSSYQFCLSDNAPDDNFIGHRISHSNLMQYDITTESVYIRIDSGSATVIVTEDS